MVGEWYLHNKLRSTLGSEILYTNYCVPTELCDSTKSNSAIGDIASSLNRRINTQVCVIVYPCQNFSIILNGIAFVAWALARRSRLPRLTGNFGV